MAGNTADLHRVFMHVCLIDPLPEAQENDLTQTNTALIDRMIEATRQARQLSRDSAIEKEVWENLDQDLSHVKELHGDPDCGIKAERLIEKFQRLDVGEVLIVHIPAQNVGIIIGRHHNRNEDLVQFEAFEVSAQSEPTLASPKYLVRDFPGVSATVSFRVFSDTNFQKEVALFLERASMQPVSEMMPKTWKAGVVTTELRDTTNPALITEIFMGVIEAFGKRVPPHQIRKHTWDSVLLGSGTILPWRRSPLWLVLRVGVQRALYHRYGATHGYLYYKFLICIVLANLLEDVKARLHPYLVVRLIGKLGKRLAKLSESPCAGGDKGSCLRHHLFESLGTFLSEAITVAWEQTKGRYQEFIAKNTRQIPRVPKWPHADECMLQLRNSRFSIGKILDRFNSDQSHTLASNNTSDAVNKSFHQFSTKYQQLAELEEKLMKDCSEWMKHIVQRPTCEELGAQISHYMTLTDSCYIGDPIQISYKLLTLMELWVCLDQAAIETFPLLENFSPCFPTNLFEKLQLPWLRDLSRIQAIEKHLLRRNRNCNSTLTIFSDPQTGCLAEQWFDSTTSPSQLHSLYQEIELNNEDLQKEKRNEFEEMIARYERGWKIWSENDCTHNYTEMRKNDGSIELKHLWKGCPKHLGALEFMFLQIAVHEQMLPDDVSQKKALLAERCLPKSFIAYRDATWQLISHLGNPNHQRQGSVQDLAWEYGRLSTYSRLSARNVTLGSTTKSFDRTHYKLYDPHKMGVPRLSDACKPNGMRLRYCTNDKLIITSQSLRVSFGHFFALSFPPDSPYASLQYSPELDLNGDGPTSNQAIASQTKCPSGISTHEFKAFLTLASGKERRWLEILVALGSTELNFSSESISQVVSRQALQVGPLKLKDTLRLCHSVFSDKSFCERLLQQLDERVQNIATNWRETTMMDLLLTIALRLRSLSAHDDCKELALSLVLKIREIAWGWIRNLQDESAKSKDIQSALVFQRYARAAAIICKQTFAYHLEGHFAFGHQCIHCFLEASIALQNNLPVNPRQWGKKIREKVIQDVKRVHHLRKKIEAAIECNLDRVTDAVAGVWPAFAVSKSMLSERPCLSPRGCYGWIEIYVPVWNSSNKQVISLNWIEGTLLVDGRPIGNVPANFREDPILKGLFGEQILRAFPSRMPGMEYVLEVAPAENQIHLGFRDKELVVRSVRENRIKEFVPSHIFRGSADAFDLPAALIDGCTHWLDLHDRSMEVRRTPWIERPGDWKLHFDQSVVRRRNVSLIDPASLTFKSITRLFEQFELAEHITAWKPDRKPMEVRLERLNLKFVFQESINTLVCKELQAKIDKVQDIGTWTGLESKLVLRKLLNPRQRVVLLPMGEILCRQRGIHMAVRIRPNGQHCTFTLNDEIGRLECAPEPRLFYLKALLHAYTSTALPDSLTGRTGVEEALHCLKSGYCQPFAPLDPISLLLLNQLTLLSPTRSWYPETLKVLETVQWDSRLSPGIQHEAFFDSVETVRRRAERLAPFTSSQSDKIPHCEAGDSHLRQRALYRRQRYECPGFSTPTSSQSWDSNQASLVYTARDTAKNHSARTHMLETLQILLSWPSRIAATTDLAGSLSGARLIRGFNHGFSTNSCQTASHPEQIAIKGDPVLLNNALSADIIQEFGPIIGKCKRSGFDDKVNLAFFFALLAYRRSASRSMFRLFVAFSVLEDLKEIDLPEESLFANFIYRDYPTVESLAKIILNYGHTYESNIVKDPGVLNNWRTRQAEREKEEQFLNEMQSHAKILASHILAQWPKLELDVHNFKDAQHIDIQRANQAVQPILTSYRDNIRLSEFIDEVVKISRRCNEINPVHIIPRLITSELYCERTREEEVPTLSCLVTKAVLTSPMPATSRQPYAVPVSNQRSVRANRPEIRELQQLVRCLQDKGSQMRTLYVKDLLSSLQALLRQGGQDVDNSLMSNHESLKAYITHAFESVYGCQDTVISALQAGDEKLQWLETSGMLPRMTPVSLLELLRSTEQLSFGTGMKEALVNYGLAITALQRLIRIESALLRCQEHTRLAEISNTGHENWSPLQYPDWLLLEIDANFLLRPQQVKVAQATISPASKENSLLQLQMGQGKSLCIVPAVSAIIADRRNLLRVVVPRPLFSQTAQAMQRRLGGLVGRSVIHIPFSRRTPTNARIINEFHQLHTETMEACGVVIAIPEHIMSFKLSGQQRLAETNIGEATRMVKVQQWLEANCRDILDESDHTLSPKVQLIYPGGGQQSVHGSPQRWEVAQALFRLTENHIYDLLSRFRLSMEVVRRAKGGLPFLYFLRKDVEDELIALLVNDAKMGAIPSLPLPQYPAKDRDTICKFVSLPRVAKSVIQRIEALFRDNQAALHVVYLLRGFLVHRLLLMTLKRRWNVHYGMHPEREGLSVPFQYKGIPSDTAEWGHPDVAILFTCLSFYYGGLNESQLRESLQVVAKSDNPTGEYEHWIHSLTDIPSSLKDWNAINVEDHMQMSDVHRYVQYSMPAINYYLNTFVFPKYAKQFSTKLQSSAWDLPLFHSDSGPVRTASRALTTGFSGTTDGKYLFPLNIRQVDLPGLLHTDAEVLSFLLLGRNREYQVMRDFRGRRFSEIDFLWNLQKQNIRVLIDAGAQIMELDNKSLALAWLGIDHKAQAAVFFNNFNKLTVIYRDSKTVPLAVSPFAENLEDCVVYFAQANCRGSDVHLPTEAHAALTLSLGQTKDATVQAAMRLRLLGVSQSVTWFASPEVNQSILDHQKARKWSGPIDSGKVISWLLEQSCEAIESLTPLFYSQGKNFCERFQAERDNPSFLINSTQRSLYLRALQQPERQTLEELYAPRSQKFGEAALKGLGQKLSGFMKDLDQIKRDFDDRMGSAVHSTALEEVEVEREYEHEVEEVREAQRQVHFKPLLFGGLHQNFKTFIETGRLRNDSTAAELAFNMLKRTGPGRKHGINSAATSSKLMVTTEFCRTVEIPTGQSGDNFLRQPRYILWSNVSDIAVLVSPEETEMLLSLVRSALEPKVHLLLYAAPLTRRMMIFNNLNFLGIPPLPPSWKAPLWLKTELGLFAGKLYFAWDEYEILRDLLGLHDTVEGIQQPVAISKKPITLIQELLDLRRKDQDFYNTPMGYIAQGKKLSPEHAFFESSIAVIGCDNEVEPSHGKDNREIDWESNRGADEILDSIETLIV